MFHFSDNKTDKKSRLLIKLKRIDNASKVFLLLFVVEYIGHKSNFDQKLIEFLATILNSCLFVFKTNYTHLVIIIIINKKLKIYIYI